MKFIKQVFTTLFYFLFLASCKKQQEIASNPIINPTDSIIISNDSTYLLKSIKGINVQNISDYNFEYDNSNKLYKIRYLNLR